MFRAWFSATAIALCGCSGSAQESWSKGTQLPYADIPFTHIERFEDRLPTTQGVQSFSDLVELDGFMLGERFDGQEIQHIGGNERVNGTVLNPLTLRASRDGTTATAIRIVELSEIFGVAMGGLTRFQQDTRTKFKLGAGSLALKFNDPQSHVGLTVIASEKNAPSDRGIIVRTFNERGRRLGVHFVELPARGTVFVGFSTEGGEAIISGVALESNEA
ncbi:MAG: hypothetical protein ACU0DW_05105 [Shimia sp.]